MNKLDLARDLARQSHSSRGKAADDVDTLVYNLLKGVKSPSKVQTQTDKSLPLAAPKPRPGRAS